MNKKDTAKRKFASGSEQQAKKTRAELQLAETAKGQQQLSFPLPVLLEESIISTTVNNNDEENTGTQNASSQSSELTGNTTKSCDVKMVHGEVVIENLSSTASRSSISQPASAKVGTVKSIIVDDCQSEAAQNSTILSGHIKLASEISPSTSSIHTEDDIDIAVSKIKFPTDKGYFDDHKI